MKFLDQAKIYTRSGDGGNGCISFRREKYVEFGGPNGGNGGKVETLLLDALRALIRLLITDLSNISMQEVVPQEQEVIKLGNQVKI